MFPSYQYSEERRDFLDDIFVEYNAQNTGLRELARIGWQAKERCAYLASHQGGLRHSYGGNFAIMFRGHKHAKAANPEFSDDQTQRDIHIAETGQTNAPGAPNEPTRIAMWRPIPEKTHIVPDPSFSEQELRTMQDLKSFTQNHLVLKPENEEYDEYAKWEKRFLSQPDTYPRYLRASEWKLEEAKRRLKDTLLWRRQYKPDLIKPTDIAIEAEGGKM